MGLCLALLIVSSIVCGTDIPFVCMSIFYN